MRTFLSRGRVRGLFSTFYELPRTPSVESLAKGHRMNRARPAYLERVDVYHGWTGGRLAVTQPYSGEALTSREKADSLCAKAFGAGWAMGEHHDGGGGWGWYAHGKARTSGRFWVAINDQNANPWNSCPPRPERR